MDGLTEKQRRWLAAYLGEANGNATEAARIAGYADPEQSGFLNRKNSEIQAEIQRVYETRLMPATEVMARLSEQARGIGEFVNPNSCTVDLKAMKAAGKLHLVKAIKETKDATNIEFYDAQNALIQIGRHHKLFTDKVEHDISSLTDEELDRRIAEAEGREAPQAGSQTPND